MRSHRFLLFLSILTASFFHLSLVVTVSDSAEIEYEKPEIKRDAIELIESLKLALRNQEPEAVAKWVRYPFRREYPVPDIADERAFVKRFDEVFDEELIQLILDSEIPGDWSKVGSKGVMLHNGVVWIDDYHLQLKAVNHKTKLEVHIRDHLIDFARRELHESIREFEAPVLTWVTRNYRIRIDKMGHDSYRYVSWYRDQQVLEEPALVLEDGKCVYVGNGGNHYFEFINGNYTYICDVQVLGKGPHVGELSVEHRGDLRLLEQAFDAF